MTEQKEQAIVNVINQMWRQYGPGAILPGNCVAPPSENVIPTGIKELDKALGIGGLPMGRVVEIYGPEDGGKSAIALQVIRKLPADRPALYIDADHHLSPSMLTTIGVNSNKVYLLNVDTLEAAMEACKLAAPAFGVIVVDSLTALPTKKQAVTAVGQEYDGITSAAQIMPRALSALAPILQKSMCLLVIVNQIRENPKVKFGNPERIPGGRALKYYAAVRLDVRRVEVNHGLRKIDDCAALGQTLRVKVVKNKCAPPFREADIYLDYERGFRRRST